jgi:hypothetical protein
MMMHDDYSCTWVPSRWQQNSNIVHRVFSPQKTSNEVMFVSSLTARGQHAAALDMALFKLAE